MDSRTHHFNFLCLYRMLGVSLNFSLKMTEDIEEMVSEQVVEQTESRPTHLKTSRMRDGDSKMALKTCLRKCGTN